MRLLFYKCAPQPSFSEQIFGLIFCFELFQEASCLLGSFGRKWIWLFHPPPPLYELRFPKSFHLLSLWIMRSFVVLDVAFFFSPSFSFSKGRFFPVCGRGGKWFTRDRNQQELGNHCATMLTSKHTGQGILRIASLDKRELGILSVLPVLCSE